MCFVILEYFESQENSCSQHSVSTYQRNYVLTWICCLVKHVIYMIQLLQLVRVTVLLTPHIHMPGKVESVDNNMTICYVLRGVCFICPDWIACILFQMTGIIIYDVLYWKKIYFMWKYNYRSVTLFLYNYVFFTFMMPTCMHNTCTPLLT